MRKTVGESGIWHCQLGPQIRTTQLWWFQHQCYFLCHFSRTYEMKALLFYIIINKWMNTLLYKKKKKKKVNYIRGFRKIVICPVVMLVTWERSPAATFMIIFNHHFIVPTFLPFRSWFLILYCTVRLKFGNNHFCGQ